MKNERLVTLNDKPFSVYLDDLEFQNFVTTNQNAGIEVREEKLWDEARLVTKWRDYIQEVSAIRDNIPRMAFVRFFNEHILYIPDDKLDEFKYIILKRLFLPKLTVMNKENAFDLHLVTEYLDDTVQPTDFNSIVFYLSARLRNVGQWFTQEDAEFILAQERATFLNK